MDAANHHVGVTAAAHIEQINMVVHQALCGTSAVGGIEMATAVCSETASNAAGSQRCGMQNGIGIRCPFCKGTGFSNGGNGPFTCTFCGGKGYR